MQPTVTDQHVNRPMTNFSVMLLQSAAAFVAQKVFPVIGTQKKSDTFYKFSAAEFAKSRMKKRAPGAESAGGGYSNTTGEFNCDVYSFHKDNHAQQTSNVDAPLSSDRNTTQFITQMGLLFREKMWVSKYFTTGKWTTDVTGHAAVSSGNNVKYWSDATSTPIADVKRWKDYAQLLCYGFKPNKLVIGKQVWTVLSEHPDIVDRINRSSTNATPALVTLQAVAALMELDEIVVMEAVENSADDGATAVPAWIGGKHALLCYVPPAGTQHVETPASGYTFNWDSYIGMKDGQRIKRIPALLLDMERWEIDCAFGMELVGPDMGVFFSNVIL